MKLNGQLEFDRVATKPEGLRPYRYQFMTTPGGLRPRRYDFDLAVSAQAVRFCTSATQPHQELG